MIKGNLLYILEWQQQVAEQQMNVLSIFFASSYTISILYLETGVLAALHSGQTKDNNIIES